VLRDCWIDLADLPKIQVVPGNWHAHAARKSTKKWYAQAKGERGRGTKLMHRLIMELTDRKIEVDHRDNNGLNNRRENLRTCTHLENMRYRQPHRDWAALDAKRSLAAEYRQERVIAHQVQSAHDLTRAGMWKIRMEISTRSSRALEYQAAIRTAGIRSLKNIISASEAPTGKFGIMKSGQR